MNKENAQQDKKPFIEDYWIGEGGQKWVQHLDIVESTILPVSEILYERAALHRGENVLDVGCGGAASSIEIAKQVGPQGHVLGVDISPPILAIAKQRTSTIPNLEIKEADAGKTDFGTEKYDVIFSRFGVMFFSEPIMAFTNFHRALKTSGRLVFLCWQTAERNPWNSEPAAAVFEILPAPELPDPNAPGPFSFGDPERTQTVLTKAGFGQINLESLEFEMPLGNMDEAVNFLMRMGPAAKVISEADDKEKLAASNAIRKVIAKFQTADGIRAPGAVWIVSARKS